MMVEKLAERIVEFELKHGIIEQKDVNIYQYGYTLLIEVGINISVCFLLGIIFGSLKEVIFFLIIFIPIRSFCGGYHADNTWSCAILSNSIIFFVIVISRIKILIIPFNTYIIFGILISFFIILLSPVDNRNKRIESKEKKSLRNTTIIIFFFELMIGFIMVFYEIRPYCDIIFFSFVIQFVSMCIGKCKEL